MKKINNQWINSERMNKIEQTNNTLRNFSQKSETQRIKPYLNYEKEQSYRCQNQKILKNQYFLQQKKVLEQRKTKQRITKDEINTQEILKTKEVNIDTKGNIKIQQIRNLLSQFKTKFAKIQQKYSLPVKSSNTDFTFLPKSPQTYSFSSQFDKIQNDKFLNGYFTPTSKSTNNYTNNKQKQTFTSASQHAIWTSNNKNIDIFQPNTKYLINKFDISSPTIDTKTQDKSRFRATYGPTKCNILTIPIRKIKEAQQVISNKYNFSKCKDVESQTQDNDEQQTKQSIVIQKFSPNWRKLKRTQTLNKISQQNSQNPQYSLKRMGSLGRNA